MLKNFPTAAETEVGRALLSVYRRFFEDPEIAETTIRGSRCADQAYRLYVFIRDCRRVSPRELLKHVSRQAESLFDKAKPQAILEVFDGTQVFLSKRGSRVSPREIWERVSREIRFLLAAVQDYETLLAGECESDPYRDFAEFGFHVSVGNVCALSAHAAALELGRWVLHEIWDATFDNKSDRWFDRPWNSRKYTPPDEWDLNPVKENYSAVVKHFKTLDPWDLKELRTLLMKEAILTAKAREAKRTAMAAVPTPQSAAETPANDDATKSVTPADLLAAGKPESEVPALPAVSKSGKLILGALFKNYPALRTIEEICTDLQGNLSERSVSTELKKLVSAGLAVRPHGERKGATLTNAGMDLVKRLSLNK